MKRIDSVEDQMRGVATYELEGGRRLQLDAAMVREYGAAELIRASGHGDLLPTKRLPVMHHGRRVGMMAPEFDPDCIKSLNYFYDPRPGDFKREGETWVAARMLGPGDLDAVAGFVRDAD